MSWPTTTPTPSAGPPSPSPKAPTSDGPSEPGRTAGGAPPEPSGLAADAPPGAGLLDLSDPAPYAGRYHRTGGPGTWYASFTERGAWAELFRHWGVDEISPFEIRRRVGRAQVQDLAVLDLTSADVRAALGVEEAELIGNDWSRCQQLADDARAAGSTASWRRRGRFRAR